MVQMFMLRAAISATPNDNFIPKYRYGHEDPTILSEILQQKREKS